MPLVRSNRAVEMVARARLSCFQQDSLCVSNSVGSPTAVSNTSSPVALSSPLPTWWHEIYEAADLNKKLSRHVAVKKKLFYSPDEQDTATEYSQGTTPTSSNGKSRINTGCYFSKEENPAFRKQDSPKEMQSNLALLVVAGEAVIGTETVGGSSYGDTPSSCDSKDIASNSLQIYPDFFDDKNADGGFSFSNSLPQNTSDKVTSMQHRPIDMLIDLELTVGEEHVSNGVIEGSPELIENTSVICPEQDSIMLKDAGDHVDTYVIDSGHITNYPNTPIITSSLQKYDFRNPYPSHHSIYLAKLALNSGKEHITPKGKVRSARHMKQPCPDNCTRCQNPRMSEAERLCINEQFWNLQCHLEQWKFIMRSLKVHALKSKSDAKGCKGEKLFSRTYFFTLNGESKRVCKTMFKNTLSMCDSWINSAILHCSSSSMTEDRRGRHANRPKRRHK